MINKLLAIPGRALAGVGIVAFARPWCIEDWGLISCAVSLVAPRGVRGNFAPRTQRQSLYAYFTYGDAYQPERRKSHLSRHASHLTVLSFTYRELKPHRRNCRAIADRRISRPQFFRFLDEIRVRRPRREVA